MAFQVLIPGLGYVDETSTAQRLIPGIGYIDESSGGLTLRGPIASGTLGSPVVGYTYVASKTVGAIKPKEFVQVDLAHPMARGISFFALYVAGGTFYDAVTQSKAGTSSNLVPVITDQGSALHASSGAFTQAVLGRNPNGVFSASVSVIACLRPTALNTSPGFAAGYVDSVNGFGPAVGIDSFGHAAVGCQTFNSSVLQWNGNLTDTTGHNLNTWLTVACSSNAGASYSGWVNGTNFGLSVVNMNWISTSGSTTNPANSLKMCKPYSSAASSSNYLGDIAWVIGFNRIITNDDAAFFYRTPYAILKKKFVIDDVTSSGSPPVTSSNILSHGIQDLTGGIYG